MSNVYLDDSILTGIANSIRTKTGGNSIITPANMATAISNISGSSEIETDYVENFTSNADVLATISNYYNDDLSKIIQFELAISTSSGNQVQDMNTIYKYHKDLNPILTNQTIRTIANGYQTFTGSVLGLDFLNGSSSIWSKTLFHTNAVSGGNKGLAYDTLNNRLIIVSWKANFNYWDYSATAQGFGYLTQEV